jgi:hypothetical protein
MCVCVCCLGFRCCRLSSLTHAVAKRQEADAAAQRIMLEIARQRSIASSLKLLLSEKPAPAARHGVESGWQGSGAAGAGAAGADAAGTGAALPRGGRAGGGSSRISSSTEGEGGGGGSERGGDSTYGENNRTGGNGSSPALLPLWRLSPGLSSGAPRNQVSWVPKRHLPRARRGDRHPVPRERVMARHTALQRSHESESCGTTHRGLCSCAVESSMELHEHADCRD